MNNLKINITLGPFKIELEGEEQTVITQFETIKKDGLGQIVDQLVPIINQAPKQITSPENHNKFLQDGLQPSSTDTISLKDIVLKGLPQTEAEWITIYADSILQQGCDTFTREDLAKKYKDSNRWSKNNMKNLSNSIKGAITNNWIRSINDTDFTLRDEGRSKVEEIMKRTNGNALQTKKRRKLSKKPHAVNNE